VRGLYLPFEFKSAGSRAIEARDLPLDRCELKFVQTSASAPVQFKGYASKWGGVDSYGDTIVKGAFKRALSDRMPIMLSSHDRRSVVGKYLSAHEDDTGLAVHGELTPGHSKAGDLAASLKHGALSGLSIGGYTVDSDPIPNGGRAIKEFDLYEVSPVAMPADESARIDLASVKSLIDQCEKPSDFERVLREAGLSKGDARDFVSRFTRTLRREAGSGDGDDDDGAGLLTALREISIPKSLFTV
jgi:HK97 family phage prohead protease